jgi:hypothetical protein
LEKEVMRFYDETGVSSGKEAILEQRLNASWRRSVEIVPHLLRLSVSSINCTKQHSSLTSLKL